MIEKMRKKIPKILFNIFLAIKNFTVQIIRLPNLSPKFQTLSDILSKKSDISLKGSDTIYFMEIVFSTSEFLKL